MLKRAENKCEFCGLENYSIVRRVYKNTFEKLSSGALWGYGSHTSEGKILLANEVAAIGSGVIYTKLNS